MRDSDRALELEEIASELEALVLKARHAWIKALPELKVLWPKPAGEGVEVLCPYCDQELTTFRSLSVMEPGYTRIVGASISYNEEEPSEWMLYASTDGWDDMTEEGEYLYLECEACDGKIAVPEERLEWS
jgi:hypothetical protein